MRALFTIWNDYQNNICIQYVHDALFHESKKEKKKRESSTREIHTHVYMCITLGIFERGA